MATHKLGKLKFNFSKDGLAFRFGDGEIHRILLSGGVAVLEGILLGQANREHYFLSALPLSLIGENGAPCRAVIVEEDR